MSIIPKTDIVHIKPDLSKIKKQQTPGPGTYDIGLPLIKPNFEAIRKSKDVMILKINHHMESFSFRSEIQRFPEEKNENPGPGAYQSKPLKVKNHKLEIKKYSKRYSDLIQFMNKDRVNASPMPDYKIQYNDQQTKALKSIKNSVWHQVKDKSQMDNKRKSSILSTNRIVKIKSRSSLAKQAIDNTLSTIQVKEPLLGQSKKQIETIKRTIDFPQQSQNMKSVKRTIDLQKEQKLVLHRMTVYNRNMIGMLMAKNQIRKRCNRNSSYSMANFEEKGKQRYQQKTIEIYNDKD